MQAELELKRLSVNSRGSNFSLKSLKKVKKVKSPKIKSPKVLSPKFDVPKECIMFTSKKMVQFADEKKRKKTSMKDI